MTQLCFVLSWNENRRALAFYFCAVSLPLAIEGCVMPLALCPAFGVSVSVSDTHVLHPFVVCHLLLSLHPKPPSPPSLPPSLLPTSTLSATPRGTVLQKVELTQVQVKNKIKIKREREEEEEEEEKKKKKKK